MTTNPDVDEEDDDFCTACWARRVALDLVDHAIWNAFAADCDYEEIQARVAKSLKEIGPDAPDEHRAEMDQPAAGSA